MPKKQSYSVTTFSEIKEIIDLKKNSKNKIIFFLNDVLVNRFGIDWLKTFIKLTDKIKFKNKVEFYVDCGKNYGLCILVIEEKVNYIKIKSNSTILKKIDQIAKKNKVLLNPNFDIVDFSKYKK